MLGATAVVAVATMAAPGAQACDTVFLAQVAQFNDSYAAWRRMWARQGEHRAAVEAMPDCPELQGYPTGGDGSAHYAFLEAHDAYRYSDAANRLGAQTGALVNAIFETPAQTASGVLEKVRILYIARGDYDDDGMGDTDLEVFQDAKNSPWFGHVIADLERLAGEVGT